MTRHIFVIDDPKSIYDKDDFDAAFGLLGDIEGANGNDCGISISWLGDIEGARWLAGQALDALEDLLNEAGHDDDCILRCLEPECGVTHACDMTEDHE